MTAGRPGRADSVLVPAGSTLLAKLVAVVRAEFRSDVVVFDAADPVFGGTACAVACCLRPARGSGFCQGHHVRWAKAGCPPVEAFVAATPAQWRRQQPNLACRVDGCGYGVAAAGLCLLHCQNWRRAGHPDLMGWLIDPPKVKEPVGTCQIGHCRFWAQASNPFCHAHNATWRTNGRPDVAGFVARFATVGTTAQQVVRLVGLHPHLRLEVAYGLQCRNDERATKTPPEVVSRAIRFMAGTGIESLLHLDEGQWRVRVGEEINNDRVVATMVTYFRRRVEDLDQAGGWEAEYPRAVWAMRRLGFEGNQNLDFTGIPQPWLAALVKRWIRWRLSIGMTLTTVHRGLVALTRFAGFCERINLAGMAQIDRGVLERWLAELHAEMAGRHLHGGTIGQLNLFLQAVRQHRWDDNLPTSALLFPDDQPARSERPPRALAEHVMAQIEHPDNLARWGKPDYQLTTLILIRAGLRVTDALALERDCIARDAQDQPYLRYYNHKMKREALVPIDEELRALIAAQQNRAEEAHPGGPVLFPRPSKNPDGRAPVKSATYRGALYRWLQACQIRDERGAPVQLTPHQWRHTLGTRLINRDVPQEVVRRILDHESAQMTAHYARLHDDTIRRHWQAARAVDIAGNPVPTVIPDPMAEAAWTREQVARATQALPNGLCVLPVQNSCPHANACLTCPMFATTTSYLPEHRHHRDQVSQIIQTAQDHGHQRVVEMNQQILVNLDRIITCLQEQPPQDIADAS